MKSILLMLMLISSIFATENTVTVYIDGKQQTAEIKFPRTYYFRCIDGYKWIQFVNVSNAGDANTPPIVREERLPIQMYQIAYGISIPVSCK